MQLFSRVDPANEEILAAQAKPNLKGWALTNRDAFTR